MKLHLHTLAALIAPMLSWSQLAMAESAAVPPLVPFYKYTQTLVASTDVPDWRYLAFPTLLDLGSEVLVSFKRGDSHALDKGARLEVRRLHPSTGKFAPETVHLEKPDLILQSGEFARFPNGDIANYVDLQAVAMKEGKKRLERVGLVEFRSTDGGKSFQERRVGQIDGVEYGYAFEAITREKTTWMLVMTFANLPGGKAIKGAPSHAGSVDVIRTDDNGKTWRFIRSITSELGGAPINESSFAPHGDGFIIAARGYDKRQWLLLTDGDFKVQRKVDLTSAHTFIKSVIGRPRVFARDGGFYLMGRNFLEPGATPSAAPARKSNPMRLSLFKFDPETLVITKHVLLDNAEAENVTDGYYAVPYWQERGGRTYFNTITYKRMGQRQPDIIGLEFDWDEVR